MFPKCVIIIGNIASLNPCQVAAFENFRNSLSNILIVTFDKLYQRVIDLISILSETSSPAQGAPKLEDDIEKLPF